MDATAPPAGNLYLVVGYDGSPPAIRALDAAGRLLHGRTGSIEVVYVGHVPSIDMLSPGAVTEMEASFDDIARELDTAASEQLRGREEHWRFERRQGLIPDELIAAAADIRDAHPGDNVVIVVGSSSHAMHRLVGSVAVSLARRSPVPLVVVPQGSPDPTAGQTIRDIRVAEVVEQDIHLDQGEAITYRTKLQISFKYESGQ